MNTVLLVLERARLGYQRRLSVRYHLERDLLNFTWNTLHPDEWQPTTQLYGLTDCLNYVVRVTVERLPGPEHGIMKVNFHELGDFNDGPLPKPYHQQPMFFDDHRFLAGYTVQVIQRRQSSWLSLIAVDRSSSACYVEYFQIPRIVYCKAYRDYDNYDWVYSRSYD